jgi:hypothetical protein
MVGQHSAMQPMCHAASTPDDSHYQELLYHLVIQR